MESCAPAVMRLGAGGGLNSGPNPPVRQVFELNQMTFESDKSDTGSMRPGWRIMFSIGLGEAGFSSMR